MHALGYFSRTEWLGIRRQQDRIRSRFGSTYQIRWFGDLGELVAFALKKKIRYVLIAGGQVLAREPEAQAAIIGLLEGHGLKIQSADDSATTAYEGLRNTVEVATKSLFDALGKVGYQSSGRRLPPGPKPYGSSIDYTQCEIEQRVLATIARLRNARWSYSRIAKYLNAENILTRRRKAWHPQTVARTQIGPSQ